MKNGLFVLLVIFTSFVLTELIRRYTLNKNLIDIPNERSSHKIPTPRGGGLSIVVLFLISLCFIDSLSKDLIFALTGSGIVVAVIGFWDDHVHIPAKWRLMAHFLAASWVLFWLGGLPVVQVFEFSINPGLLGLVFVSLILVWLLNLFNFMDGIDGIAASEAIFVACAGAFFSWKSGLESLTLVSLFLAASTSGFLILNWPPAKIFMGDVGSGFLGLMMGVIAYANILKGLSVWIWVILLAVFLVDSGVTLIRRIFLREKWYLAHCSHAYQHAAKNRGHKQVTVAIILINILWLFPLAYLTYVKPDLVVVAILMAYVPLIIGAFKLKAGTSHTEFMQD